MKSKRQDKLKKTFPQDDYSEAYGNSKTKKVKRRKQPSYDDVLNQMTSRKHQKVLIEEQFYDDDDY